MNVVLAETLSENMNGKEVVSPQKCQYARRTLIKLLISIQSLKMEED